eukprot:1578823-Rhodomonas_salina.1
MAMLGCALLVARAADAAADAAAAAAASLALALAVLFSVTALTRRSSSLSACLVLPLVSKPVPGRHSSTLSAWSLSICFVLGSIACEASWLSRRAS